MSETTIKGALFDLDGVLINSEPGYTVFWQDMDDLYPTGVKDFAHVIKGTTLHNILSTYFPDPDKQADIVKHIDEFEATVDYPLFPGALDFITDLKRRGIPVALYTSSSDEKMHSLHQKLPNLIGMFDIVITGNMVKHSKPDPEGYIRAAEALGCDIHNCYVFEDSLQGVEAGRRSGATVIGIATTNPRAALEASADMIVDTIADITVEQLLNIKKK